MNNRKHVIGKQVFEAEYNSTENGLAFRNDFTTLIKGSLLSIIEEVLDELSPKNAQVRIGKLDLDLGTISYPIDEYSLKEILRKKLRDELNFKIVAIRQNGLLPSDNTDSIISISKTEEEILLFFLSHGYLPWWASVSKERMVSIEAIITQLVEKKPEKLISIIKKIKQSPEQVKRFLAHSSNTAFYSLISVSTGIPVSQLQEDERYLAKEGFENQLVNFSFTFKEFLIQNFLLEKISYPSVQSLFVFFGEYLIKTDRAKEYELVELFPEKYLLQWIKRNFPAYTIIFKEYSKRIEIQYSSRDKRNFYQALYLSFLKNRMVGESTISVKIAEDVSLISKELAEDILQISVSDSGTKKPEEAPRATDYFERAEDTILRYLQFGVISWEDRITGIQGIESLLTAFHQNYPDRLKKVLGKIKIAHYPAVLWRLEHEMDKEVKEMILSHYFSKEAALEQLASVQYRDQLLRNFFETGTAPWAEVMSNSIPYVESILISFYEKDPIYFVRILKEYSGSSEIFIRRIAEVYSAGFTDLMKTLLGADRKENEITIPALLPSNVDLIVYYLSFFEKNGQLPAEVKFSLEELIEKFLLEFPREARLYFITAAYSEYKILKQKFPKEITIKIEKWILPDSISATKKELSEKSRNQNSQKKEAENKMSNEPIYLSNAGLILLHPFLQRLFSICNLLEKRKFKDEMGAQKAVHLLQYLATKEEKCEEHQLVLNKILCGIPLSEPIDRTIQLSEEEKEHCESMIRAVVENWAILKKTSNANFRVSFLQREGRLLGDEASWRLKVEDRSYDMLLDKLPWAISMIKLPWMEKMMYVEWR